MLLNAVFLVLGVVLTLVLQLAAGQQARQRERDARLFDARRVLYEETLREVGKRTNMVENIINGGRYSFPDPGPLETNIYAARLEVLGSEAVSLAFEELAQRLNPLVEAPPNEDEQDAWSRSYPDQAERLELPKTVLYRAMAEDLGVGRQLPGPWQRLTSEVADRWRRATRRPGSIPTRPY
jgi:hypothetical protein